MRCQQHGHTCGAVRLVVWNQKDQALTTPKSWLGSRYAPCTLDAGVAWSASAAPTTRVTHSQGGEQRNARRVGSPSPTTNTCEMTATGDRFLKCSKRQSYVTLLWQLSSTAPTSTGADGRLYPYQGSLCAGDALQPATPPEASPNAPVSPHLVMSSTYTRTHPSHPPA